MQIRRSFSPVIAIRSTVASLTRAATQRLTRVAIQRLNRVMPIRGVNIGGGSWSRLGWYNADTRHSLDEGAKERLDASSRLPFADGSIDLVFSSHFFEHVDDATADNLLRESLRVLRRGGLIRISVPDFELALSRYRAGDDAFFDENDVGFAPRYENWRAHGVAVTLPNKLSFYFCGYSNKDDHGRWPAWKFDASYYCGPVAGESEKIDGFARRGDVAGLSTYLVGLAPRDAFDYGHINWWTEAKFREALSRAGFREVVRSRYRGSSHRELRAPAFDNRPGMSLYVEALK